MIPAFPKFKKLEIKDRHFIEGFTKQFPPYNDFDFVGLWTYNPEDKKAISILNNNLVIKFQDIITRDFFYSFLGTNKIKDTITRLLAKNIEDNFGVELKLVPEINIKNSSNLNEYFIIKEDPDNFDYILSVNDVAELKGNKYHDKRNLVNTFRRLYPDHSVELLDLTRKKIRQDIKELFFSWEQKKGKNRTETEIELIAIEKLFELAIVIKILGIGIYIMNKLIGFSTFHTVQNNFALLSFQKGDTSYKGIFEYLNSETAKHLKKLGSVYLNYEQDLGIEGLKKAKTLWRPIFFLRTYRISSK